MEQIATSSHFQTLLEAWSNLKLQDHFVFLSPRPPSASVCKWLEFYSSDKYSNFTFSEDIVFIYIYIYRERKESLIFENDWDSDHRQDQMI